MTYKEAANFIKNAKRYYIFSDKMNDAISLALEALDNMERHLCFTCNNNAFGICETQNVIKCECYEKKET